MAYVFGAASLKKLEGVHPRLVSVATRALAILSETGGPDMRVDCGVRTKAEQRKLYAQGRTDAELRRVGITEHRGEPKRAKVTWTLESRHFVNKQSGYGHAVDLLPLPVDWNNLVPFNKVADAMFQAARELGVRIRWGADWDGDGNRRERGEGDSPHFELAE